MDAGVSVSAETPSAFFATKTVQQTANELNANLAHGLTSQDAEYRRKRYGRCVQSLERGRIDSAETSWKWIKASHFT
jgi:hypothetical protein